MNKLRVIIVLLFAFMSCTKQEEKANTLFSKLSSGSTNIHFKNIVKETPEFNFLNYTYIYNGGGVAVGDINNDGFEDLFFTANHGDNKLYLNQGDFEFKDITKKANVTTKTGWTTGVSMVDINNDGWLDIYVCKSGSLNSHPNRRNKLFINQKDNTFKESSREYGLDHIGFSTQAYFFDFDNDGDLDLYLVNHRKDFSNSKIKEPFNSDQLFRNDNGHFTNITKSAGLLNKGWGLSASIGDFNNDSLLDIYVANDFFDPDYLYINQGNGTFKDEALSFFDHISTNSMGSDFADINNDLLPDLIVLDMMAEDHIRSKENMATMSTSNFNNLVKKGHHYQYMSNVLQLNNGNNSFSEIGQLAGIAKTDWSWAPLIADFDNDGYNDVFVTNGIKNDLTNQDFRKQMKKEVNAFKKVSFDEAKNLIPSEKISNYSFKNSTHLSFENTTKSWGLDEKINSNGAAYADLDNDGDLDLVINNQDEKASIYKNNSHANFITISLEGSEKNKQAIGAQVSVFSKTMQQQKQLFTSRGFQSSVSDRLHFGLAEQEKIDSIIVRWADGKYQKLTTINVNQTLKIKYQDATTKPVLKRNNTSLFQTINPKFLGIDYNHKENPFDDFKKQVLLPQKQSGTNFALDVADVNNDGLDDFFVGNSKGENAALYIQNKKGYFIKTNAALFNSEKEYEDTDAKFIDLDADGDLDLYVCSGGYEIESESVYLQDRIYINNGRGRFKKGDLPKQLSHSKGIANGDYDKNGDQDVFVGGHVKHGQYPLSDNASFYQNKNKKFTNAIYEIVDSLSNLKLINDAVFSDYDNDGDLDLIVVGEWMPITFFENQNGKFYNKKLPEISEVNGWFQTIKASDVNKDGLEDYIIGNWGDNNKFHPTKEKPLHIYADYLDDNTSFDMVLSKVSKTGDLLPVRGKECSSEQTPFLNEKIKTFKEFASFTLPEIYGKDKLEQATHYTAHSFASMILINKGNGQFITKKLPREVQFSPTLGFEVADVNRDGFLDIFGVGNVNDTEVETIKYDASKNYLLLGNESGDFNFIADTSYYSNREAKAIKKITINNRLHFIILNKNEALTILKTAADLKK